MTLDLMGSRYGKRVALGNKSRIASHDSIVVIDLSSTEK